MLLAGLVVPDVPLEETEILRKEAVKNKIELVWFSCLIVHILPFRYLNGLGLALQIVMCMFTSDELPAFPKASLDDSPLAVVE